MLPRTKKILAGTAALALIAGIPAIAQDRPESILPPGFGDPANTPEPVNNNSAPASRPSGDRQSIEGSAVEIVESLLGDEMASSEPTPQVEYPRSARRDPHIAGTLDPIDLGIGSRPWGAASGKSLQILMRRMDTPLASRWAHIGLRNALLARAASPANVNPADWAAERAWLLLRMGEADAGRLLVASVDNDRFTPKMNQVALQSALASSDPSAMCPLENALGKLEPRVVALISAICASLSGESERAAADIEAARRRGRVGGIDLALADKVVGAGAETARAVTIEWEPVDRLNSWRYGLSTATGMMPPAPMFQATQRLPSARIAAALGVMSSQALIDLYSTSYDTTDPDELGSTEGWQLRLAFIGKDQDARLAAMRTIWGNADSPLDRVAARVLLSRAARRIVPEADLQSDAPDLVASLLAGGFDREAARWAPTLADMDHEPADKVWAMLALGAPDPRGLGINVTRIENFADRDKSEGKQRTALLVAGLAGLGRISPALAGRLNRDFQLGLGAKTGWTGLMDGAMQRRQAGTVMVLTASALQGGDFDQVRAVYMFHAINALQKTGQNFLARMIAAEALART